MLFVIFILFSVTSFLDLSDVSLLLCVGLITIDIRLTCYTMGIQFELKIYFSNCYHYVVIECHSFHPKKAILMRRQHYEGYEMMVSNANMKRSMLEELLARVIIKWSASSACVEAEIEVLIRVPVPVKAVVYM